MNIQYMTLLHRAVKGNMESVKLAADDGNDDHQLNCYGLGKLSCCMFVLLVYYKELIAK